MPNECAAITTHCPKCSQTIEISQRWTAGGVNDYGGWVLECTNCSEKFAFDLGRDFNDSRVISGAFIRDSWDRELGEEAMVLERNGLKTALQPSGRSVAPAQTEGSR